MPSINNILIAQKQKLNKGQKVDTLAALFLLLAVCDAYSIKKADGGGISLTVWKNILSTSFIKKDEFDLVQPLGNWLCSLPKSVWNDKK